MVGDSLVTDVTGSFNANLGGIVWVTHDGVHKHDDHSHLLETFEFPQTTSLSNLTPRIHTVDHFYSSPNQISNQFSVINKFTNPGLNNNNQFFLLRHGNSEANAQKIISSDPKISTVTHGLTPLGEDQANAAGELFSQLELSNVNVVVHSSDFKRALETANIFASKQKDVNVVVEKALRERNFGSLNGEADDQYQKVWDIDRGDSAHTEFGVESVESVATRTLFLVERLNDVYENKTIVLVAHGDVLQILQAGMLNDR